MVVNFCNHQSLDERATCPNCRKPSGAANPSPLKGDEGVKLCEHETGTHYVERKEDAFGELRSYQSYSITDVPDCPFCVSKAKSEADRYMRDAESNLHKHQDGDLVFYTEHVKALRQCRLDALEANNKIIETLELFYEEKHCSWHKKTTEKDCRWCKVLNVIDEIRNLKEQHGK